MAAVRRLLPVMALTLCPACGADDVGGDAGVDGAVRVTCDPPATPPDDAVGAGALPAGTFGVRWTCVSGCDGTHPLVIEQADHLTIDTVMRPDGARIATITWSVGDEPLHPISAVERDGCWYRREAIGLCTSAWALCPASGGGIRIAHIATRDPVTGNEQIWRMD